MIKGLKRRPPVALTSWSVGAYGPEKENARPKRLLAEKELAIDILNELAKGKF
jgi:hypothetical protein